MSNEQARDSEAREAIEAALGSNLTDNEWAWLVAERYTVEFDAGDLKAGAIAAKVRGLRQTFGTRRRAASTAPRVVDPARAEVTTATDVRRALTVVSADGMTVASFRARHVKPLRNRPGQLKEWLDDRVGEESEQGHVTSWLRVPVAKRHKLRAIYRPGRLRDAIVPDPPIKVGKGGIAADGFDWITITAPYEDEGTIEINIAEGGTLYRLQRLAARIAREVGWTEVEAMSFILTDAPPQLPLVDTEARGGGRVQLSVHPSVTPRELLAAYSALRKARGLAIRNLTPKHMALAAFREGRPEGETWPQRMKVWNDELPKEHRGRSADSWVYTKVSNFARDADKAKERMEERHGKAR